LKNEAAGFMRAFDLLLYLEVSCLGNCLFLMLCIGGKFAKHARASRGLSEFNGIVLPRL
jgi:hypothetical protein